MARCGFSTNNVDSAYSVIAASHYFGSSWLDRRAHGSLPDQSATTNDDGAMLPLGPPLGVFFRRKEPLNRVQGWRPATPPRSQAIGWVMPLALKRREADWPIPR